MTMIQNGTAYHEGHKGHAKSPPRTRSEDAKAPQRRLRHRVPLRILRVLCGEALLLNCLAASLALADMQAPAMLPDASNAALPTARSNLGIGVTTLPFGIRDDSSATPAAGGSGYVVGDQLTLNDGCATHGVLAVATVSTGAVTAYNIVNRGSCASVPANPVGVLSTTGTGSGATFTLNYGPLGAGCNTARWPTTRAICSSPATAAPMSALPAARRPLSASAPAAA